MHDTPCSQPLLAPFSHACVGFIAFAKDAKMRVLAPGLRVAEEPDVCLHAV